MGSRAQGLAQQQLPLRQEQGQSAAQVQASVPQAQDVQESFVAQLQDEQQGQPVLAAASAQVQVV